ncbi:hypothetical protein PGRAN_02530 [Listeria grandensis FSL F6-0971]|uniref:Uncharacterized protein n=1 Tax=Listeria grandensis FSL F6-0971 TaxID=1265819 RepID=W7BIZ4_9LIST|nr:hypothetical protein [Listeria grandensis]EUJ24735.1 hypothetical protein PGRAN_02530 [Listeria grandensis FSL F6-0971]
MIYKIPVLAQYQEPYIFIEKELDGAKASLNECLAVSCVANSWAEIAEFCQVNGLEFVADDSQSGESTVYEVQYRFSRRGQAHKVIITEQPDTEHVQVIRTGRVIWDE